MLQLLWPDGPSRAWPVYDFVNNAVLFCLLRVHDEVSLNIAFNAFQRLLSVLRHQLVGDLADAQNLAGMNIDISRLTRESAHRGLVDQDTGVRKGKTFTLVTAHQQKRRHACRLADAIGNHVVANE